MSTLPPPPSMQYSQQMPAQPQTNVPALISLICGILGCFVITPIIGIITGVIGIAQARPPRGGKGIAVAGIVLSVLWIVGGIGMGALTYWGAGKVKELVQAPVVDTINTFVAGDISKAKSITSMDDEQVRALSDKIKSYGKCTAFDFDWKSLQNDPAATAKTYTLRGTATFEKAGAKQITATIAQDGETFKVVDVTLE